MENDTKSPTTLLKKPIPTSSGDPVADNDLWTAEELQDCKRIYGCTVLHQNANTRQLTDKSLPNDAYLVTYVIDGKTYYDLTRTGKRLRLFDMYWDKYREGLKSIVWGPGTANPKTWGEDPKPKSKK